GMTSRSMKPRSSKDTKRKLMPKCGRLWRISGTRQVPVLDTEPSVWYNGIVGEDGLPSRIRRTAMATATSNNILGVMIIADELERKFVEDDVATGPYFLGATA